MRSITLLIGAFWSGAAICGKADATHDHGHGGMASGSPQLVGEYVENKGQWNDKVLFRADFGVTAIFAETDRLTFSKWADDVPEKVHEMQHEADPEGLVLSGHAWYMKFTGAQQSVQIDRIGASKDYFNYFIGNDPAKWASEVRHYKDVRYRDLWPGVDLRLYDQEGAFKYDLELDRAELVDQVKFTYEGLLGLRIDNAGQLQLTTSVGELYESVPVAWYADGAKEKIECSFVVEGNSVGFKFKKVDRNRPVVIDPLLIASTLSGTGNIGTTQNYGHTATYDEDGNIYTGAICFGQGYPTTPGAFDATYGNGGGGWGGVDIAVSKLDPTGSNLLFATYLGGDGGDYPHSMVVTNSGELTVYGSTDSNNYPTANAYDATHNGSIDIVVTKLNPTGTALIGSTYIGSTADDGRNWLTNNYGDAYRGEIICDVAGRIYIASCSHGNGFPTTPGAYQTAHSGGQDGVAFCLSPGLNSMVWSTYIGTSADDMAFGMKLNSMGEAYVCGGTSSGSFPTTAGAYQPNSAGGEEAFIVHLDNNASSVLHSTYFGTSGQDIAFFIQLDLDEDVYIYGQSPDGTVPIQPAGTYGNPGGGIFVASFSADLSTQIFSTSIGPSGGAGWSNGMVPVAFLVDVCDNIYISGYSVGTDWATTAGALYTSGGFYLAAYEEDMTALVYGTYYEGAGHVDGGTSRFDANGIVYQAVCTSGPFPTTPTAFSNVQPVGWDVGVFKIDFQVAGVNAAGASTLNEGCAPIQIDFSNASTGDTWFWDFGDGSDPVEAFEPSHLYSEPGNYIVTLIALDSLSCNLADTTYLPITIGTPQVITADMVIEQLPDCQQILMDGENLSTGENIAFIWTFGDGTTSTDTNVTHVFSAPGEYNIQLIAYDPSGCSPSDTVSQMIELQPEIDVTASFTVEQEPGCDALNVICESTSLAIAPVITWDMGDGTELTGEQITHQYDQVGTFTITMILNDTSICGDSDQATFDIDVLPTEPVNADFTADQTFDCTDLLLTTVNNSTGSNMVYDWQLSDGGQYDTENVEHVFSGAGTYTITLTVSDGLGCSPPSTVQMDVVIDPLVPVVADFEVEQVGNCELLTIATIDHSTGDSISLSWDMGDGTVYTGAAPTHVYTDPGIYNITLTVSDLGCGDDSQMILPVEMINELPIVNIGDSVVCPGATATLTALATEGDLIWNTGETTSSITVEFPGIYTVTVSTDVCQGTATIEVIEGPEYEMAYEVEACPGDATTLTVPIEGLAYEWSTGGTDRSEQVLGEGEFIFDVIDLLGCPHRDTVTVITIEEDPQLFAPNAFSPDGDGLNEEFKIVGYGEKDVKFTIFDRWGELLWESTSADNGWDGSYKGSPVKNDIYVYQLKYTGICNAEEREVIGHVMVVR